MNMALKLKSSIGVKIYFYKIFDLSIKRSMCNMLDWEPKDVETHTGQKFSPNDYRLCRFMDKEKLVNPNWAIKLIADVPPIQVKERVTFCDGGSGALGHPRVYINLDKPGYHSCLYCGLRYFKEDKSHH